MSVAVSASEQFDRPARPGRLRQENLTDADRNYSVIMHLSLLALMLFGGWLFAWIGPLVLWLVRREHSFFNDDHGREVLNFSLSFLLWHVVLIVTVIGAVLIPVLWIVAIVNCIRGAIAAGNSEYFRYPVTVRFLS